MLARTFFSVKICCVLFLLTVACTSKKKDTIFSKLEPSASGIHFRNEIQDTDSTNSIINEFGYMGGGVGVGDFNNDGLKDLVFTANQVSSRIYINKGENKFEDITDKAGFKTDVWATGVSIVDVNNDGYDDIYVCTFGKNLLQRSKNLLFVNQRNLTFKEQAAEYGLADTGYSSQAVFFDYDRDGDLDMYLANYSFNNSNVNANNILPRDRSGNSIANDRLYRNDGDSAVAGHPRFSDVTLTAGIKDDGYGLGVSVSDFNNDGWPDIYVANDFVSNDYLWLNNQNGTFTNRIDKSLRHQSYSSMGVDAADLNNDGLSDVVTLDMLPEENERKKTSFFFMNYERYQAERFKGYEPSFMRNMLQLNNGNRFVGDTAVPFFSEIGQMAGIAATDWSWSVLLADYNNDGRKDMHITNGVGRDFINADFLEYSQEAFTTISDKKEQQKAIKQKLASLNEVALRNYLYKNNNDYSFRDISVDAGIDEPSLSNGAAYADLDNDGDLDLIVNNINKEVFVFINNTVTNEKPVDVHFLKLVLKGEEGNRRGVGTKVCLFQNGAMQMAEQNPVRGYFSSVDQDLFFGLGKNANIDSLVVIWPNGRQQSLSGIPADTTVTLEQKNAAEMVEDANANSAFLFTDITSSAGISFRHAEYEYNDFANQRLLPQKFSQMGPYLATGDVNSDGTTDFFIGAGGGFSGKLFLQGQNQFLANELANSTNPTDDMDCLLFDADGDGDQDLLLTAGDVQLPPDDSAYRPRLFLNNGKGQFTLNHAAIPANAKTIAGSVSAGDYDRDGDMDLFIGGRVSSQYPMSPQSFLLQNNGGVFSDVTKTACPQLQQAGMITSSAWMDVDGDGRKDLVIAGDWMPLRFFHATGGKLTEITAATGLTGMNGMWRSLAVADIDGDGDEDIIAGNLGQNCLYHASGEQPMALYAKDLDGNGSIDPIFFYHIKGADGKKQLYPAISRAQFADQVPAIRKQFLQAKDYAKASFNEIFTGSKKDGLQQLTCEETRSCFFENLGGGKFKKQALPVEAQFAPVNAIVCDDFDGDGYTDLLLAGNEYQSEVMTGRYDASYGCFLKGGKDKTFRFVPPTSSGFLIDGDVKDMAVIQGPKGEKRLLVAVNNDSLRVFRIKPNLLTVSKRTFNLSAN
ncbi:VCBS repeat-containing protein [Flavisolibacter sp. BT320]|nr:VCBS repeat-containing protein [Flavisolibacter longurius]